MIITLFCTRVLSASWRARFCEKLWGCYQLFLSYMKWYPIQQQNMMYIEHYETLKNLCMLCADIFLIFWSYWWLNVVYLWFLIRLKKWIYVVWVAEYFNPRVEWDDPPLCAHSFHSRSCILSTMIHKYSTISVMWCLPRDAIYYYFIKRLFIVMETLIDKMIMWIIMIWNGTMTISICPIEWLFTKDK